MFVLREEFEAISFDHLNKVGINSMPNAFAFLFGRQMESLPKMSDLTHDYINQLHHADDTFYKFFKEIQLKTEDSFSSHKWDDDEWDVEWKSSEFPEALHGSSLFHTLTKQPRDCPSLHIPFAYCQCEQKYTEIKPSVQTNELIKQLTMAAVEKLNKDIASYKYADKCAKLSLDDSQDRILKLEKMHLEKRDTDEGKKKMHLLQYSESAFKPSLEQANLLAI
uniref:Uncharacterized protein n=1 Tax=Ditylenchus dipsaci TaxID=166011 RepID=A0A915ESS4_9BILA